MATEFMTPASAGNIASSAEYNKLINNILDLNDRLGTGVTTGSGVTNGTATVQLTDLRSRATVLETRTTDASTGNSALGSRVTALESTSGSFQAPAGIAYATAVQAVAGSAAVTPLVLGQTSELRGMTVNLATGTFTIGSGSGGLYRASAVGAFGPNVTGRSSVACRLRKNGADVDGSEDSREYLTGMYNTPSSDMYIRLVPGDTVQAVVLAAGSGAHASGQDLVVIAGRVRSRFELVWIAA